MLVMDRREFLVSTSTVAVAAALGRNAAAQSAPVGKASNNLPPFPQGVSYLIGRLPIKGDTSEAIVQLPEATAGVSCAVVLPNTGVLSDCYRPARGCVPNALRAQPINDREIRVTLDGTGDKTTGPGWVPGAYPGSAPETRAIDVGVPYVEVVVFIGPACGCSSENWVSDTNEWG